MFTDLPDDGTPPYRLCIIDLPDGFIRIELHSEKHKVSTPMGVLNNVSTLSGIILTLESLLRKKELN